MKKILLVLTVVLAFACKKENEKSCYWCTVRNPLTNDVMRSGMHCEKSAEEAKIILDSLKQYFGEHKHYIGLDSAKYVNNPGVISILKDTALLRTWIDCNKQGE